MADLFPGSQVVIYTQKETDGAGSNSYGTVQKTGKSMYTLSENLEGAEEREVRPDRSGQADHTERYTGRKSATWEVTKLLLPQGSAGGIPDDTHLWEAGFGHASVGATAVEYVLATLHDTSLTIRRGVRSGSGISGAGDFQDHVIGAICNRIEVTWGNQGNNGLAQVVFAGEGKEYGHTGNTSLALDGQLSAASISTVTLAQAKQFSPGSLIILPGLDTGGGSGIIVDTINYTNNTFSASETLDATHSNLDAVKPYNPTASTSGSPLHAKKGQISLDGGATTIKHLGGRMTLEQNTGLLNEEVGDDSATQVLRNDRRNVTFALEFIMKKTETYLLGDVRINAQKDIEVIIGSQTGKRLQMYLPASEFNFTPANVPEQEVARISLEGQALANNVNDSVKARFI
jgi:hypothetical protein